MGAGAWFEPGFVPADWQAEPPVSILILPLIAFSHASKAEYQNNESRLGMKKFCAWRMFFLRSRFHVKKTSLSVNKKAQNSRGNHQYHRIHAGEG